MSQSNKRFLGMPGSWKFPGWSAIGRNMWNKNKAAHAFPPKVWGYGWSINFAYPLIQTKPLWKRVAVFITGLLALLLVIYVLVVLVLLALLVLFPKKPEVVTLTINP